MLWSKINNTIIRNQKGDERQLTLDEKRRIVDKAHILKKFTYAQARKELNLSDDERFNISYRKVKDGDNSWDAIRKTTETVDFLKLNGYHTLKGKEFSKLNMASVDKAIFRALKPGGYFVVIDTAAKSGAGFTAADSLQRSDEDALKAEVLAAGFVLDGESKVQANASDDHSKSADLGGTPDTFALRFKKPANAKTEDKRPPKNAMDGYYGNTVRDNYDKEGAKSGDRERREFYHADGTYQEFGAVGTGNNPFQTGYYWWDVDGHNCMLHRFPSDQRDFTVCHGTSINKKPGDKWVQNNGRGEQNYTMLKGYVYFGDDKDQ